MRCNVGGDIVTVDGKPTCDELGGTVVPEGGTGGGGTCMAEVLHRPGRGLGFANFDIAAYGQEFRDQVLTKSDRGRKIIDWYESVSPMVFEAVQNRPDVLGNLLVVASVGALFSHQILHSETPEASNSRFPRSTYETVQTVLHGLRLGSEDQGFHATLDEIGRELEEWVGRSPAEVRKRLGA